MKSTKRKKEKNSKNKKSPFCRCVCCGNLKEAVRSALGCWARVRERVRETAVIYLNGTDSASPIRKRSV